MDTAKRFSDAQTAWHAADEEVNIATLLRLVDFVREEFPGATHAILEESDQGRWMVLRGAAGPGLGDYPDGDDEKDEAALEDDYEGIGGWMQDREDVTEIWSRYVTHVESWHHILDLDLIQFELETK